MLKMMGKTSFSSSSYSYCRSTRGMLFLHTTPIVALFPSKSSNSTKSRQTQRGKPRVGNVEHALKVFDEMLHSRPLPSAIRFTQILTQLARLKHYSAVISLNREMSLLGIASNVYTLTIIINCYCHLNQMGYALSVLGQFFKSGLQPDVATFTTLIHGFVLQNRVAEAARLFSKMLGRGHCQPNVFTFNTLIKGFCMIGNNSAAMELLRKMEERGCQPDTVTYNTIIDSLCKDTLVDQALNLFTEMIGRGIAPSVVTYNSLIDGVCRLGKWKEAKRLLNEMVSKNIFPNVRTFTVLVDALCKEGMVAEAKSVVEMMIQRGIEPDMVTYSSLMDGYCL
ncbi:putative tetratricopeptide-like helical domain-containing protein [Rosa chinensis]|uniref:Putative tetratricopeptide-like helical domain-containing protein n=3 Tax=Rosa chinensis TaxID=74649 RepID=A0A2P6QK06_ROSCH|nr:putative tetratricopeptide-like helical domain-containing protein [Rosa chinensis]